MRKIEQQMNDAIASGNNLTKGNTTVTYDAKLDTVKVFLYGNLIAELGDYFVQIFDGGFKSATTKSRLNAILHANGCDGDSVFQKGGEWFITDSTKGQVIPFRNGYVFA